MSAAANVDTDGMKHLRELCSRLSKEGAVAALLAAMQSDSNISSFEFLNSGTVHQLKDYLLGAHLPRSGCTSAAHACSLFLNYHLSSFAAHVYCACNCEPHPFAILTQALLHAQARTSTGRSGSASTWPASRHSQMRR